MDTTPNHVFLQTGKENAENFMEIFDHCSSVYSFLKRDEYISVRSSKVSHEEQAQLFSFIPDIDGCVVEWNDITYIKHPIRKLYLCADGNRSVRGINSFLRKHLSLSGHLASNLLKCRGFQLMYEAGWEYWIGLVPHHDGYMPYDASTMHTLTYAFVLQLRTKLAQTLRCLLEDGLAINTINKNNISSITSVTVLPDDQTVILNALQDSINAVETPRGLRKIVFSFRFGEKAQQGLDIPTLSSRALDTITAHVGVNIRPPPCTDILWSRSGISDLVGNRGTLTSCMSFYESGNFQSNLDGRPMDVNSELLKVSQKPNNVKFIQLYADTPHQRPKTRFHPVSGCMAANKAVNHVTRGSFQRDSLEYLSVVGNNMSIMRNFQCRLEFVTSTPTSLTVLKPLHLMDIDHLQVLISNHALITPFHRGSVFSDTIASVVANIGLHMVLKLRATLDVYKGTGNCAAVWSAYQLELAVEKLLWGNPICTQSYQSAVNLGIGLGNPSQCKTDSLGFLALEHWEKSAQSTDVPPPVTVWTSSDVTRKQIKRVFGFHDLVGQPCDVVGRRALIILIEDFYHMGVRFGMSESEFLLFLKGQGRSPPTSGTTTVNQLTHQLSQAEGLKFPMVWGAIIDMLRSEDLGQILQAGIKELDLMYFPAFRLYDSPRHPSLMWHTSFQYRAITESCTEGPHRASVLTQVVLGEMDARKLAHTSHLRREFTRPFPWILPCAKKLEHKALPEKTLVSVLTFVSCIALFQNERFVSYYALRRLHDELPIPQHELKRLEILGKLPVSRFNMFPLHRIHQSIPIQLPRVQMYQPPAQKPDQPPAVVVHTDEVPEGGVPVSQTVKPIRSRHLPSDSQLEWDAQEIKLLEDLEAHQCLAANKQCYFEYQRRCRLQQIPDRSFPAFRGKVYRFMGRKKDTDS